MSDQDTNLRAAALLLEVPLRFVLYLRKLTPSERVEALKFTEQAANFCWLCGRDYDDTLICHCQNDE